MTPDEWEAAGLKKDCPGMGKYAGTFNVLVELIIAMNRTIYRAKQDEILPSCRRRIRKIC